MRLIKCQHFRSAEISHMRRNAQALYFALRVPKRFFCRFQIDQHKLSIRLQYAANVALNGKMVKCKTGENDVKAIVQNRSSIASPRTNVILERLAFQPLPFRQRASRASYPDRPRSRPAVPAHVRKRRFRRQPPAPHPSAAV